jgi:hypothetical protein
MNLVEPIAWCDSDGRPALGWIVRNLEQQLLYAARNDDLANAAWEDSDQAYFVTREDYRFWRRLQRPAFWRQGKKPALRPRSTTVFTTDPNTLNALEAAIPDAETLKALPSTVRWGIIGAIADFLYQEDRHRHDEKKRGRQHIRDHVPQSNSEPPTRGESGSDDKIVLQGHERLLIDASQLLTAEALQDPVHAALFLIVLGRMAWRADRHSDALKLREQIPELILKLVQQIDPSCDLLLRRPGLPRLSLDELRADDLRGLRFVPVRDDDQCLMIAEALKTIAEALKILAIQLSDGGRSPADLLRMRAAVLILATRIYGSLRERLENYLTVTRKGINFSHTQKFYLTIQAYTLYSAAKAAELTDDSFLAAKLWSIYIFLWNEKSLIGAPPDSCYRLAKEAGLLTYEKTPHPARERAPSSQPLSTDSAASERVKNRPSIDSVLRHRWYEQKIGRCTEAWDLLKETVPFLCTVRPDEFLRRLNKLIKVAEPAQLSEDSALREDLAKAGFDVAMCFGKIELAHDFLMRIRVPEARSINEFLHNVRLALQWGAWGVRHTHVEEWFEVAENAIARCCNFNELNDADRLYCHEILLGRFVKLSGSLDDTMREFLMDRLKGNLSDSDIEDVVRTKSNTFNVGMGEITLGDLTTRLADMSAQLGQPVVAVSLFFSDDFGSILFSLPKRSRRLVDTFSRRTSLGDVVVLRNIRRRLDDLLKVRSDVNFAEQAWFNAVPWPEDLILCVAKVLDEMQAALSSLPGHILLAVNAPYHELPWQHLIAVVRMRNRRLGERSGRSQETPTVSLVPNFGILLLNSKRQNREPPPQLLRFPEAGIAINDEDVRKTLDALHVDLERFREFPSYAFGFVVGHGALEAANPNRENFKLPRIEYDRGEFLQEQDLRNLCRSEAVFIGSCGVGSAGESLFGDMGGALRLFLVESSGILFTPATDISPKATEVLARELLRAPNRSALTKSYLAAIRKNEECFLYSIYGVPTWSNSHGQGMLQFAASAVKNLFRKKS